MHFWIDKRSHTCGFGRARVAASLSGTGLGFGHLPRRMGGKSMVTPVHRYQPTVHRCGRSFRNDQQYQQQQQQQQQQQHQQHQHHHHSQAQSSHGHGQLNQSQSAHTNQTNHIYQYHHQTQPYQSQTHHQSHNHPNSQPSYICNLQAHQNSSNQQHTDTTSFPTTAYHSVTNRSSTDCNNTLHQINQSSALELERGTLGVDSLDQIRTPIDQNSVSDTQLLPSHLKCGMWASLALATVFVAVFQGTGLEVLSFCAFSASFFIAACTISICRRPRDVLLTPSLTGNLAEVIPVAEHITPQLINPVETGIAIEETIGSPPPYHIAILLPENSKDIQQESPPPSYDKLGI